MHILIVFGLWRVFCIDPLPFTVFGQFHELKTFIFRSKVFLLFKTHNPSHGILFLMSCSLFTDFISNSLFYVYTVRTHAQKQIKLVLINLFFNILKKPSLFKLNLWFNYLISKNKLTLTIKIMGLHFTAFLFVCVKLYFQTTM